MNKYTIGAGLLFVVLAVFAGLYYGTPEKFNVSADQISKDLPGQVVALPFGQAWPFDASQQISVKVLDKKKMEEFMVLAVNIEATANVPQEKEPPKDVKEQTARPLNPKNEAKKEPTPQESPAKLPSKVALSGVAKVTYEKINDQWYLIRVDSVSLKAQPKD